MALTFDQLVDRAQAIGPEVAQATIVSFANERTGRMVAEAEYRQHVVSMAATTVAGQNAYALDTDVVDLRVLRIGTAKYALASMEDVWELEAGRGEIDTADGKTGVFAAYTPSSGTPSVYLYPAPTATGSAITAIEATHPSDSVYAGADNMSAVVPKHMRLYVLDGVLADVYEYTGRWDEAQPHEQRYEAGIDRLRRLKNSRVGSGPQRIRLTR